MRKLIFVLTGILILGSQYFLEAAVSVEVKIGTGIENLNVTGVAETFPASTPQLVGWCRIKGAEKPMQIIHQWKLNGKKIEMIPLAAKSRSFRTHSRIATKGRAGKWSLEVQDMDSNVLASAEVQLLQ